MQSIHGHSLPALMAMDFCAGGTLEQWIRKEKVTEVTLVNFLTDFIEAMIYMHVKVNVVHRGMLCGILFFS